MKNNYIAMAIKDKEYLYKKSTVIKCNSQKQASILCNHLNTNNKTACDGFKCNNNEIWYIFSDLEAIYKVKTTKGKISVVTL